MVYTNDDHKEDFTGLVGWKSISMMDENQSVPHPITCKGQEQQQKKYQ